MNTRSLFTLLAGLVFLASLSTCGIHGNDDASQATSNTRQFQLYHNGHFKPGHREAFVLTASDLNGVHYQGQLQNQTGAATTFNGIQAIPVNINLTLTDPRSHQSRKWASSIYYSITPHNRQQLGMMNRANGTISLAREARPLPETASIGDTGIIGLYTNTAGQTRSITWRLTDAGNGLAGLVLLTLNLDINGKLIDWFETTSFINSQGECQSLSVRTYDARNDTRLAISATKKWL